MLDRLKVPAKVATGFLVACFFSLPLTVNALGFGNINMKSALNEPLVAEIELLSATPDDVKILEVKLASKEAFLRAGVDRSVLLSRIKFNVVRRSGKYFINLRTRESVREPFLNFLLEMNWKSGRMLREYTVLLDPPDRVQRQQQVAQAPVTAPAETFVAPAPSPLVPEPEPVALSPEPAPEPVAIAPEPEPAPVAPADESPFLDTPAPTEQTAQADDGLFPYTPIDESPQVPSSGPESVDESAAEPAPVPEPVAVAPEPLSEPEPVSLDEPELITPSTKATEPEPTFQPEEEGLFPEIPMQNYDESGQQVADAPELAPAEDGYSPEPYEPVGELDYGITQKGDNAWKIATKLNPSQQISVYQVMMALQQSNPDAFIDGNIHRLKEGQVMRIDDASLLTAISKEQAAEQYQVQTQVWEEYVGGLGGEVPRQPIVAGADQDVIASGGEPSGELTLATPTGDDLSAGTGGESTGVGGQDTALLQEQVRQAMSEASSERNKNTSLTRRLEELEQELKRLENAISVKDSDLAALQARLSELNEQRRAGASQPAEIAQVEPEPVAIESEPVVAEPEPVAIEPEPAVEAEPEPDVVEPEPAEPIMPVDPTSEAPIEPSPLEAPSVDEPEVPADSTTPSSDGGIMATLMGMLSGVGSMLYIIIGVVAAILIAIVVMIVISKRKGVNFQESILTNVAEDPVSISMDAAPSQGSSLMGGESSFLSDFAISGVSAIQAEDSEVDPLTEADVFMAYGRYEAAEERLQEAISQDPGRGELRVKLLELFNTTKNKSGFESSAEEFYATLGDGAAANPLWQKVVAMGAEIAPGNPMFSGEGMPTMPPMDAVSEDKPSIDDSQVMDIGLDTGVFSNSELTGPDPVAARPDPTVIRPKGSAESNADSPTQDSIDVSDLDFSLDNNADGGEESGLDFSLSPEDSSADIAMPASDDLSFDLQSEGDESTQTAMPSDGGLDFSLADDGGAADDLDFNLDLDGDDEPTATDIKLDMDGGATTTPADPMASADSLDFDLNIEEDLSDVSSAGMDMNLDASDAIDLEMPTGADEVGTKLDLARAYIDMGDPDGARSILDEVIDEGDDGQKSEAEQLMAQIA